MHIEFVRMVKLQFFAQFPVDHPAHLLVSSLVLFLCKFAAFAYHVIDRFVSLTTLPTSAVLLFLICSCFDMVVPYYYYYYYYYYLLL